MQKYVTKYVNSLLRRTSERYSYLATRVLQKVLSLGSDYFSATFYQTYFYNKPSKYSHFTETHLVTFLPSREKQINSLLLVSVGDTDK